MKAWGLAAAIHQPEDDPPELPQARVLQIPAPQQQQNSTTASASNLDPDVLGCCLRILVLMCNLAKVSGNRAEDDDASPLAVDTSAGLYGIVLMLVICTIALREMGRSCYRSHNESIRLRSLHQELKLPKRDMRRLNGYLKRDPGSLLPEEREEMILLADAAGVDLTGILLTQRPPVPLAVPAKEEVTYVSPPPPPLGSEACAAEEDQVRRRRTRASTTIRSRAVDYEGPSVLGRRATFGERMRDAEVQCSLGGEVPKKVYFTPRGTCVHASRDCSTLNSSTKFQERDVCQKCVKGQREEVDMRGFWCA